MEKRTGAFLVALITFIIASQSVLSEKVETYSVTEFQVSCSSNDVTVNRFFYIPNNNLNNNLFLRADSSRYLVPISESLNPEVIELKDNFDNIYPKDLVQQGDILWVDIMFPTKDVNVGVGNQYLITLSYSARDNAIVKEGKINAFDLGRIDFKGSALEEQGLQNPTSQEVRVILPRCFFYQLDFAESYPKEAKKEIIDGKLILTYDRPTLNGTVANSNNATAEVYEPSVRFRYSLRIKDGIIFVIGCVISGFIGAQIPKIKLRKKKK